MTDAKIIKAKLKRDVATSQLTRVRNFVNSISDDSPVTLSAIEVRYEALEKCYESFMIYQNVLEELVEEELGNADRANFEEEFYDLKSILLNFRNKLKTSDKSLGNNSGSTNSIKLPKIMLPCFSGNFTEWIPFFSTFNSLVNNNKQLDELSKFHYLRTSLTGQALNSILSIEITAKNYPVALKLLKDRYDNNKLIAQEHLKGLFNLPSLHKDAINSINIRKLIDNTKNHLEALASLGRPTAQWDDLIVYLVLSKLDSNTRTKWEDDCRTDQLPTLQEVFSFLDRRCQILDATYQLNEFKSDPPPLSTKSIKSNNNPNASKQRFTSTSLVSSQPLKCQFCFQPKHNIYRCRRFLALPPNERIIAVKRLELCANCLKGNHTIEKCPQSSCRECGCKHNTLLHQFESTSNVSNSQTSSHLNSSDSQVINSTCHVSNLQPSNGSNAYILLATAIINVLDHSGAPISCRAILDSGSQSHFISQRLATKLGLPLLPTNHQISGISNSHVSSTKSVTLNIQSRTSQFCTNLSAFILPKITNHQPSKFINVHQLQIPQHIELADPEFYKPSSVDLLIGAELHFDLIKNQTISLGDTMPQLRDTSFGWIIAGKVDPQATDNCLNSTALLSLDQCIQRFWEIESHVPTSSPITKEQSDCEESFNNTVRRNEVGRFVVKLPFKLNPERIGNSQNMALKRFINLERRLDQNEELRIQYNAFMSEYLNLGHMNQIHSLPINHYFLPHHCVLKPESSSTKLRVVFDGSAKSSTKLSLNDVLMKGPTVQSDLFTILLKFRIHPFVFTGDISKMYRQILVDEDDRKYQCIVWRENSSSELKMYELNTVTYGSSSAPYLATRCLQQLANEEESNYPHAARILREDFYVDDVMSGAQTIPEANKVLLELIDLLKLGGFDLRKFCANQPEILRGISKEYHEKQLIIHDKEVIKTLGLNWQPIEDCFQFNILQIQCNDKGHLTKREIASQLAQIFDPLGIIGPVVVFGKILLQQLWKLKLNWDENLPYEHRSLWFKYRSELPQLNQIKIPRLIFAHNKPIKTEIHAFSDSSERAYGTCCYLRLIDVNGVITSNLICAKSRVAPIQVTSLPRLELCAALLMSELIQRIQSAYNIEVTDVTYWTDSTIVLAWLAKPSYSWHTFVANRVSKIQSITSTSQWRHIDTNENPADLISRGMHPSNFIQSKLWFNGPAFLKLPSDEWPTNVLQVADIDSKNIPEGRTASSTTLLSIHSSSQFIETIHHRNDYSRLIRIIAYCYRFKPNCSRGRKNFGPLQSTELQEALIGLIRYWSDAYKEMSLQLNCIH